jgi:protein involved in polysaccharide export with SLBB domain
MKSIKKITGLAVVFCSVVGAQAQDEGTNQFKTPPLLDMNTLDDIQKLQKGYVLDYQVFEDRDQPIKLTVTDSGDLVIPYFEGLIKVAGKTCRQVAFDVKKELESTHYKRATVRVSISSIAYTNIGTFSVQGYVKTPGLYQLLPGETYTVAMAIAKAGGGTDFANLRKVMLTRVMDDGERRSFTINVKRVVEEGKLEEDMDIQAADQIYVPQSFFR